MYHCSPSYAYTYVTKVVVFTAGKCEEHTLQGNAPSCRAATTQGSHTLVGAPWSIAVVFLLPDTVFADVLGVFG